MPAVLEYQYAITGWQNVERVLARLERRYVQHGKIADQALGRIGGGGGGGRGSAARQLGPTRETFYKQQAVLQKLEERRSQQAMRLQQKEHQQALRLAQREDVEKIRAFKRRQNEELRHNIRLSRLALAEQRRMEESRRSFLKNTLGSGASSAASVVGSVGRTGAAVVGAAGAALAYSSVNEAIKLDELTRRLSIAGRGKGEKGMDPMAIQRQFTNTAIMSGFSPEQIAQGASTFTAKTGDLGTALKNQQVFATVAQGAGANVVEVFAAAADLSKKMDISSVEKMQEAFAILSAQGKKGSFELKAMAGEFPEVLSSAANAGMRGVGGVRDVGAIMQLARQASGSDSEASTAVQTMFRQLAAKSDKIQSGEALGGKKVKVFEGGDATKPMRNFIDVVMDVMDASGGNQVMMQDIFDVRGIKAINPMLAEYRRVNDETVKAGGTKKQGRAAGKEAITKMFGQFRDVNSDYSEVQRDANDAMKSFSVQMEILNTRLKDAVASEIFPELIKLGPELVKLVPHVRDAARAFVSIVEFFARNPFTGLGAVLAAAFAAEIAKAAIGQAVGKAITGSIASASIGAGAAGAIGLLYAAAAASVVVAMDQASKLGDETSGITSKLGYLPGFDEKGNFGGAGRLWDEATMPMQESIWRKQEAGANAAARAAAPALSPEEQKLGDAQRALMAATTEEQKMAARKQIEAADAMLRAAQELSKTAAVAPNRGNSPSPIKN